MGMHALRVRNARDARGTSCQHRDAGPGRDVAAGGRAAEQRSGSGYGRGPRSGSGSCCAGAGSCAGAGAGRFRTVAVGIGHDERCRAQHGPHAGPPDDRVDSDPSQHGGDRAASGCAELRLRARRWSDRWRDPAQRPGRLRKLDGSGPHARRFAGSR